MPIKSVVHVLLVEDNPADALLVRALLGEAGGGRFEVAAVGCVAEAVLRVRSSPVDVVLLDLSLPDSIGMETIRDFHRVVPGLPIVVLTGLEDKEIALQAIREGCQDYLVKGQGDGDGIARAILYSIERKRLEKELVQSREEHRLANERYRLLVNTSPDALLVCTADEVFFVNEASRRLCPDSPAESDRRGLSAHVAPRDVPQVGALIEDVINGVRESGVLETQLRTCDGQLVDAEVVVLAIEHEGARAAEVIVHELAARREADHYRAMAATVFEGSAEAMIVTDAEARVRVVNAAFTEITGYRPEEIIGRTPHLLSSGRHPPEFYEAMWRTLVETGRWRGDVWNRRKAGDVYVQHLTISAIRGHDGAIQNFVGVFSDVTEQRRKEDTVRHKAFHDALTGLPNRALLEDRLEQAIVQARRREGGLAVLFLDLDGFKPVNDLYGHRAGDELLRHVARQLKSCVREVDTVARLGGDEFVVILSDITDRADVVRTALSIADSFVQPVALDDALVTVGGSIGIALFPEDGDSPATLLASADAAMYEAKRSGKGGFCFFVGNE